MTDLVGKIARNWHYLQSNKTSSVPERHVFVDTETSRIKIGDGKWRHDLKLGWACYIEYTKKEGVRKEEWLSFRKKDEFWNWLDKKCHDRTKLILWAHNIGFDLSVLGSCKALGERGWKLKLWVQDAQRVILTYRKDKKTLQVLDTLNFFKASLKQIGEDIGLSKGEVDFDTVSDDVLSDYCRNDVEIVKKVVIELLTFIIDNDLGTFKYTVAGQAFTAFKHRFMTHKILVHNNLLAINLERAAYRGGRSEVFRMGEIDETVYNLDVNSMYPYMMQKYLYPTLLRGYSSDCKLPVLMSLMNKFLVIAKVKVYVKEPCVGIKKNWLIFPVGNFDAVLTSPELSEVTKFGVIKNVLEVSWYDKAPIFRAYVDYMYSERKKAKQKGDKTRSLFYKYLLNSIYGKFGQKNEYWKEVGEESNEGNEYMEDFYDFEAGKWRLVYHFGGKIWDKSGFKEGYDSFVAIPAFVSAYARCYLWELIKHAGLRKNIFYCDTDSLFVNQAGYERLKPYVDQTRLGYLSDKGEGLMLVSNVKDYVFNEERNIKGVRKEAKEIKVGVFKQHQFSRFRTALKKGAVDTVEEKEVTKHLTRDYNKGVVRADGWVTPYELVDGMTEDEIEKAKLKYDKKCDAAMNEIARHEGGRALKLMKSDFYDADPLLEREEQKEDILREAKRWIRL